MIIKANQIQLQKRGKSIRNLLISRLNRMKSQAYLSAFILGDKSNLDLDKYQINGVAHLLAISGLHVDFLVNFLTQRLKIRQEWLLLILLSIYCNLVFFSIGVVRVLLTRILKDGLRVLQIKNKSWQPLFLSAVLLLLYNPFLVYNYGFLYSYGVAFGLAITPITGNYFQTLFKISLVAFGVSIPITVASSFCLNPLSVFNNLIFVPLVTLIIFPLAILTVIFPFLDQLFFWLTQIMELLNQMIPFIKIVIPKIPFILVVFYYLILIIILTCQKPKMIFILILLLLFNKYRFWLNPAMTVYFLDVGQGDASLIIYPHRSKVIMIDCGGQVNFSHFSKDKEANYQATNLVLFLNSIGITKINLLIASHGDYDHIGNFKVISQAINFKAVVLNQGKMNPIEAQIAASHQVVNFTKDQFLTKIPTALASNENDNSTVLRLEYRNQSILFLGDISQQVECQLEVKAKIIKLAHHGSASSSNEQFLQNSEANIAIISAGKNNLYNHPNPVVLKRLERLKIKYFNTIIDGSICLKWGSHLKINCYPP